MDTVDFRVSAQPAVALVERHQLAVIAHADGLWYAHHSYFEASIAFLEG